MPNADSVYVPPTGHLSLSGPGRNTGDTVNKHTTDKLDEDKTNTFILHPCSFE